MLGLARFAMKSPLNVGVLAAGFAALPLLYAISAALVGLVTLRRGTTAGTQTLVWSLAGALIAWRTTGIILPLLVLPITAILAIVLRRVQDWHLTLLFAAVLGLALAVFGQLTMADRFAAVVTQIQTVMLGSESQPGWKVLEGIKDQGAYLIMAAEVFEALLCLMLARYWQAGLYNPGGFGAEFRALRYSGRLLVGWVVFLALTLVVKPAATLLLLMPLIFAGVALVHGVVARAKLGGQWLVAFYLGTVLFNQFFLPLLVLAAVTDGVFDYRAQLDRRSDRDDE
ncbi:hypothetical protein [Saccharospirillum salsuginis]|uniref:DUF2232 domain-containing protein n=1 Tax=Saccharospirillum salsuginis TaxID=418750 RepID=A0A918JZ21_9GAMM|nr:hypothetical protein [Saccharospirillum salsuginis]GGX38181.1 hypothetical protein GCM10007392_00370 [Saccharospirillum salsuginis]